MITPQGDDEDVQLSEAGKKAVLRSQLRGEQPYRGGCLRVAEEMPAFECQIGGAMILQFIGDQLREIGFFHQRVFTSDIDEEFLARQVGELKWEQLIGLRFLERSR